MKKKCAFVRKGNEPKFSNIRIFYKIHNSHVECMPVGRIFFKLLEEAKHVPIVNPEMEGIEEVKKFRPICLLNIWGKVMEEKLISSIIYCAYSTNFLNNNQHRRCNGFKEHIRGSPECRRRRYITNFSHSNRLCHCFLAQNN